MTKTVPKVSSCADNLPPSKKQKVGKPNIKGKAKAAKRETVETDDVDVTRSFAGTLVVVPPTLVQQWVHEIRMHSDINVQVRVIPVKYYFLCYPPKHIQQLRVFLYPTPDIAMISSDCTALHHIKYAFTRFNWSAGFCLSGAVV